MIKELAEQLKNLSSEELQELDSYSEGKFTVQYVCPVNQIWDPVLKRCVADLGPLAP